MTPERLEEIRVINEEFGGLTGSIAEELLNCIDELRASNDTSIGEAAQLIAETIKDFKQQVDRMKEEMNCHINLIEKERDRLKEKLSVAEEALEKAKIYGTF